MPGRGGPGGIMPPGGPPGGTGMRGLKLGGGGGTPLPGGMGGGGRLGGGTLGRPGGGMRAGGAGRAVFAGSINLKANCRKNSFVSLFQWDQNLPSDLSTSLDGTLKEIVSYGSAAKRRYCHFLSGGSTFCS